MAETAPYTRARRAPIFLLKLAVTLGLCVWIVWQVDWGEFWATLRHASLALIALVMTLRLFNITVSAFKWQQLLGVHGLRYGLGALQRWYLVATFLNHFLPTMIGGDGYRVYKTFDNPRGRSAAVLAVLVERVTGLLMLLLVGWAAALVSYGRTGDALSGGFAVALSFLFVGASVGGWCALRGRMCGRLAQRSWCPAAVGKLLAVAADFREHPGQIAATCAISTVFHASRIFCYWLMIHALGAQCSVLEVTIALAVSNTLGLLPISLGGLGLVDGSFIAVMAHYGLGHEAALSTMLLMRVMMIPVSLLGGYFYFTGDRDRPGRADHRDLPAAPRSLIPPTSPARH